MTSLLGEWRNDGFDRDDVEIWAVGYTGTESYVPMFAQASEGACFADTADPLASAWTVFGAAQDDLFIIDRHGFVRYKLTTHSLRINVPAHRALLDAWVRGLL